MKKENRIRLFDILIGALLAAFAGFRFRTCVHNSLFLGTELFERGVLEQIVQNPADGLTLVPVLVDIVVPLILGILALISFVKRKSGRYYRNLGIVCIIVSALDRIDYLLGIWQTQQLIRAGTVPLLTFAATNVTVSIQFWMFWAIEIAWGILLIIYGKKLLPAWLAQGALVASGPFPCLRELGTAVPGLALRLKQAWHEMRERNKMP